MDSNVMTVQRARGWRECELSEFQWHYPGVPCRIWTATEGDSYCSTTSPTLFDPLADTPEGAWEFMQVMKWAHEKGWRIGVNYGYNYEVVVIGAPHWGGLSTHPDFCAAVIAALAAVIRRESEEKGHDNE